jgi:hypothetical protein
MDVFFPLSLPRLLPDLPVDINNTAGVFLQAGIAYPSRAPEFTTSFLVGSVDAHRISLFVLQTAEGKDEPNIVSMWKP